MNGELRQSYIDQIKAEYDKAREAHLNKRSDKRFKTLEEARANKFQIDLAQVAPAPSFTGTKVLEDLPLEDLLPYIDWTPFFHTWELRGSYPRIFEDKNVGDEAKKLYNDAQVLLKQIVDEKLLKAKAVFGFWPAQAIGDDIELDLPSSTLKVTSELKNGKADKVRIHTLRQQAEKVDGQPYYALSDFIAPAGSGKLFALLLKVCFLMR